MRALQSVKALSVIGIKPRGQIVGDLLVLTEEQRESVTVHVSGRWSATCDACGGTHWTSANYLKKTVGPFASVLMVCDGCQSSVTVDAKTAGIKWRDRSDDE